MDWMQVLEIQQVLNRYFRALDERTLEIGQLERLFTQDARVIRPNGAALVGPATIAQSHRERMARFSSTQHLLSGQDVAIDGENYEPTLNNNPLVKEFTPNRDHTEIILQEDADPQSLLRQLVAGGARLTRFEMVAPSLNEIFIESVKRANER